MKPVDHAIQYAEKGWAVLPLHTVINGRCTCGKDHCHSAGKHPQTLNGLIYDSFLWSTMTDSQHREGCYGTTTDYNKATEPNYNINSESLTEIKGATFWGSEKLNEGNATSIEQCKAMCSADSQCTGATFNPDKAYCWTRTGEGSINASIPNDYAIIPENLKYLKVIQGLSEQLTNINSEIIKTMNKGKPLYSEQEIIRKQQTVILNKTNCENNYNTTNNNTINTNSHNNIDIDNSNNITINNYQKAEFPNFTQEEIDYIESNSY
mgnify:CR=1 FL=1